MKSFRKLNPISLGSARLGSARLGVGLVACLLGGVAHAGNKQSEPVDLDPSQFTALADGIPHPTVGCDGARVLTPRPGTQFADPIQDLPESVTSFYAKAANLDVTWADSIHCSHSGIVHWPGESAPDGGGGESIDTVHVNTAWSGYQIDNLAHYVQSGWTIPTVVNPPIGHRYSTSGYDSSIWAGMGGGHYNYPSDLPLIQAGSSQYLSAYPVTATYYFWYEIVGGSAPTPGEVQVSPPVAHPGDDVGTISIWFEDTHSTEFGICDFSDSSPPGGCAQIEWNCPDDGHCSEAPGAATTEWMVEAPYNGLQNRPLADFGLVNFYNGCWSATSDAATCYAISEPGVTVPVPWSIQQNVFNIPQTLATAGQITLGSSFTDTYHLPSNPNN